MLFQFDVSYCLCLSAVVALHYSLFFVNVEYGVHRFVVGDTYRVGAFHYVGQCLGQYYVALLNYFEVAYDGEFHVGAYYCQSAEFVVCEELARYLDDAFLAALVAFEVVPMVTGSVNLSS